MPELPEVETTVRGLIELIPHLHIIDVWTDYNSPFFAGKDNIKNPKFFAKFKKEIIGRKVMSVERRAKNILIQLDSGKIILIHMKMTGHLLYGKYKKVTETKGESMIEKKLGQKLKKKPGQAEQKQEIWVPDEEGALKDPFNKFLHLVFSLKNGKHIAFSDMRKFAKVTLLEKNTIEKAVEMDKDLSKLGPEPLDPRLTYEIFKKKISRKPQGKIKQVLMDQTIIPGIGNIYSDEILWCSDIHPSTLIKNVPDEKMKIIYESMKIILKKSISLGGDSMSDYRNLEGKRGGFHPYHNAYHQHGKPCKRPKCKGRIEKIKMGGRSAHFCNVHQK
jgi:formamidopyrimidine-DNA glycosylase